MSDDHPSEPTQKTPKGYEIPLPKRKRVESDLSKILKKRSATRRRATK